MIFKQKVVILGIVSFPALTKFVLVGFTCRSIVYASCLEGSDPIRLFEKRINVRRGNYPLVIVLMFVYEALKHSICLCSELLITPFLFPEPGYEFDRASLLEYNPMSFGGPPVTVETVEEADELLHNDEKESAIGIHVTIYTSHAFPFLSCLDVLNITMVLSVLMRFICNHVSCLAHTGCPRTCVMTDSIT